MEGTLRVTVRKAEDLPAQAPQEAGLDPLSPTRTGATRAKKRRSKGENIPSPTRDGARSPLAVDTAASVPPSVYVHVTFKGQVQTTAVIEKSSNPVWNQELVFVGESSDPGDLINFRVLDKAADDHVIGLNAAKMGTVKARGLQKGANHKLYTPLGHDAGVLQYECTWKPKRGAGSADIIDSCVDYLEGPRPAWLRVGSVYGSAKHVYGGVSGLPVVNMVKPAFEGAIETVLSKTPVKPSPENGAEAQKCVEHLDKQIEDILGHVDGVVDTFKDDMLEGLRGVKDTIKTKTGESADFVGSNVNNVLSAVHGVLGNLFGKAEQAAVSVQETATHAAVATTDKLGITESVKDVGHKVESAVLSAATEASHAAAAVQERATSAVHTVTTTVGEGYKSAEARAKEAVDSIQERFQANAVVNGSPSDAVTAQTGTASAAPVTPAHRTSVY